MEHFFKDVTYCWPEHSFNTIFDVGANKGEFSLFTQEYFPNSQCHAFEPSSETYHKLLKNTEKEKNIFCYRLALNNFSGTFSFTKDFNVCNSLILPKPTDEKYSNKDKLDMRIRALSGENIDSEQVETTTIDIFCNNNNINKIDILKIDTEGFDLNVIEGSSQMMNKEGIDIIYAELSFEKNIGKFASFFDTVQLLWLYNYEVFRIYDQASVDGKLRRANVVFTSKNLRNNSTKNIWQ
jgi:FkbM family methyltransferase